MKLSFSQFVAKGALKGELKDDYDALLYEVLSGENALSCKIGLDGVEISAAATPGTGDGVYMKGRWASDSFASASLDKAPALLVAPLLFRTSYLALSRRAITTFRYDHRSIADILMRNVYGAVWLSVPFEFVHADTRFGKAELKHRMDLSRRYLWILEAVLGEAKLKSRDMENKLVANGHFKMIDFDSPLLNSGFDAFRDALSSGAANDDPVVRFELARENMLALYS